MRAQFYSRTAQTVARRLEWLHLDPKTRGLLPEGVGLWATRALPGGFRRWLRHALWGNSWWRALFLWGEDRFFPALTLHIGLRKRFVHDAVESHWQRGVRQLVQVGAGLDSLCMRVASQHGDALCIEVDHPATQSHKRRLLEKSLAQVPQLEFIPLDLRIDSLVATLRNSPHRPFEPSIFVMEGLLMYLQPELVKKLLHDLRRLAAPGSRIIFTFMEYSDRVSHRPQCSAWVPWLLNLLGEPLLWGLERRQLPAFLASEGWVLEQCPHPDLLSRRYLEPLGLGKRGASRFERFAVARPVACLDSESPLERLNP